MHRERPWETVQVGTGALHGPPAVARKPTPGVWLEDGSPPISFHGSAEVDGGGGGLGEWRDAGLASFAATGDVGRGAEVEIGAGEAGLDDGERVGPHRSVDAHVR